jgi:hypothetical protein
MYIPDYLSHLREIVLKTTFEGKFQKSQYPSASYLKWVLDSFFTKLPDSCIRVDFKASKKSQESMVLIVNEDGISFSKEDNYDSENGHDSDSKDYGHIRRNEEGNHLNEFYQRFDYWFDCVSEILEMKNPFLDIEYYGEFKRTTDYVPPVPEQNLYESEYVDEIDEATDGNGTWLFKYGNENTLRYVLGKKGKNPLFVIGLNPSTADHTRLDPTANSIQRIATNSGFDSWIILNLYPLRSTDPYALPKSIDRDIHEQNIDYIRQLFEIYGNPSIWAAWGNLIDLRFYLRECLTDICSLASEFDCTWFSFGKTTKKGHPRHPLYLNSKTPPSPFMIGEYLKI